MFLKDELMEATSLDEGELKQRLLDSAPKNTDAGSLIEANAVTKDSWAYLTARYGFNSKEKMLSVLK